MSKNSYRASSDQKALSENMQILTGQRGDRLDKALTLRDAAEIGLIKLLRRNGVLFPENVNPPDRDPVWMGVEKPHAPVNVTADGAFHNITLTWDIPTYLGHAFAEIWRAVFDDKAPDKGNNVAKAVRIGTTLANVYADAVGKGYKAYYWVRFVNKNGQSGPYNALNGLLAETSRDIQDIINGLIGNITQSHFNAWLQQDYNGVKQDIVALENGVGNMWAVKASAGQITTGIGLVAKSDGTSQVFIASSQLFIYDPNNPGNYAPVFAIDQGQVIIQEALIRKATIQILSSEKITADYVKAGVSISAPLITGGILDMGNAYFRDGAAGFGRGGPYGGWGVGWYTIIYADGTLYTNRLQAQGGNIRNMRIGNCVIEEDCTVLGTLYANKIIGNIMQASGIANQASQNIWMPADPLRTRVLIISGLEIYGEGWSQYQSTNGGTWVAKTGTCTGTIYVNGVGYTRTAQAKGEGQQTFRSLGVTQTIPAGTAVNISINFSVDHGGWVTDGALVVLI